MKQSIKITIGVQLGAAAYALHRGETFGALLALTGAAATYYAWQEEELDRATKEAAKAAAGGVAGYDDVLLRLHRGLL